VRGGFRKCAVFHIPSVFTTRFYVAYVIFDIYILYEILQVGPFPSECFQMSHQIAWRIGCIVALVAFVFTFVQCVL
jgi:hypothetical protein